MGKDKTRVSLVNEMKRFRSPALVNLAALVFGWIALRLIVIGMPVWLAKSIPITRQSLDPGTFVAQMFEPTIPLEMASRTSAQPQILEEWRHVVRSAPIGKPKQSNGILPIISSLAPGVAHPEEQPIAPTMTKGRPSALDNSAARPGRPSRNWMLSGYALIRAGSGQTGIAANGQLGGSQIGLRAQSLLFRTGRFALSANGRISAPITQTRGKEAGLGLALKRSSRVPVELIFERRVGLDRLDVMLLRHWLPAALTISNCLQDCLCLAMRKLA